MKAAVRYGLTCFDCNEVRTFDTEQEREDYAGEHAECAVERIRLITG